jgi:hypothetical protein
MLPVPSVFVHLVGVAEGFVVCDVTGTSFRGEFPRSSVWLVPASLLLFPAPKRGQPNHPWLYA